MDTNTREREIDDIQTTISSKADVRKEEQNGLEAEIQRLRNRYGRIFFLAVASHDTTRDYMIGMSTTCPFDLDWDVVEMSVMQFPENEEEILVRRIEEWLESRNSDDILSQIEAWCFLYSQMKIFTDRNFLYYDEIIEGLCDFKEVKLLVEKRFLSKKRNIGSLSSYESSYVYLSIINLISHWDRARINRVIVSLFDRITAK